MNSNRWRFRVLIAVLSLFLLFIIHDATPAASFEGIEPALVSDVKTKFPAITSVRPPLTVIDEVLRYLSLKGSFLQVLARRTDSGEVMIVGKPLKTISRIGLVGAKALSEDEVLILLGLTEKSPFDPSALREGIDRVKSRYKDLGYLAVKIDWKTIADTGTGVRLEIKIQEGSPTLISGFVIATANPVLRKNLVSLLSRYRNERYSREMVQKLTDHVTKELRERHYLRASLKAADPSFSEDLSKVVLEYEVTDPVRYEFIFLGQRHLSLSQILRVVKLDEMTLQQKDPVFNVTQTLREYYRSLGFAHVELKTTETDVAGQFRRIIRVDIDEGRRVRLRTIELTGQFSRPAKYYLNFIRRHSTDAVAAGYYSKEGLEIGYRNLVTELQNQGFVRAQMLSMQVEFLERKDQIKVVFNLNEGPQSKINKIVFIGAQAFPPDQLKQVLEMEAGAPLRLGKIEERIQALRDFYHDNGYLEMSLLSANEDLIAYSEDGRLADLTIRLREGPRIIIQQVIVEGNKQTRESVIRSELAFEPGEILTPDLIEESTSRLNRLGLFSRAEIIILDGQSEDPKRTILVRVAERNPGLFRFGAGMVVEGDRDITLRGYTGLSYNNLNGRARAITSRLDIESNLRKSNRYPANSISIGFLEPYLGGSRWRGRINLSRVQALGSDSLDDVLEIVETNRIGLFLERDFTSQIRFSWTVWNLDANKVFQDPPQLPVLFPTERFQVATLGPTVDLDFRDNPFLPTQGQYARWDLQYAAPFLASSSTIEFLKTEGSVSHYQRLLGPDLVWANSFRTGYLKNLNQLPDSGVPQKYSFFLGGSSTLRGFSAIDPFGRVPAADQFQDYDSRERNLIATESHYFLAKSELRFPIYKILGGVLFFDTGQVYVNDPGFRLPSSWRQSAGAGVRVNFPFGPLSLDYGIELNPEPGRDRNESLHIFFGTF